MERLSVYGFCPASLPLGLWEGGEKLRTKVVAPLHQKLEKHSSACPSEIMQEFRNLEVPRVLWHILFLI